MNIAFLDIETTGLDPYVHETLEVGYILRFGGAKGAATPDQEHHFSLDIDVENASERALEVNRYHERREELRAIRLDDEVAASLLLDTLDGALVIGNNVQFDLRFLEAFLHDTYDDATPPWYYAPLDLKAYVAGRCGMAREASTKLIAEAAGVPLTPGAHSAIVDARWNRDVYDTLTGARRCCI